MASSPLRVDFRILNFTGFYLFKISIMSDCWLCAPFARDVIFLIIQKTSVISRCVTRAPLREGRRCLLDLTALPLPVFLLRARCAFFHTHSKISEIFQFVLHASIRQLSFRSPETASFIQRARCASFHTHSRHPPLLTNISHKDDPHLPPVCFTVCLFISPESGLKRVQGIINPVRPKKISSPNTKPLRCTSI